MAGQRQEPVITMEQGAADTLHSRSEELRATGHVLVDRMADYLASLEARAVSTPRHPAEIARAFATPLPRGGADAAAVWEDVWERVVGDSIHLSHPMYLGHQVAPPVPQAVLADALISLLNNSVAVWEMSPTATILEAQVIRWMIELIGYPAGADGTFVSGGSAANLTGLLAAREAARAGTWRDGGMRGAERPILVSGHGHYSIERAAGVMGLGTESVVMVPDGERGMDPVALRTIALDLVAAGRRPLAIVATAGSTATGRFEDLDAIADVAGEVESWLHVDAAHGASFLCSETLRQHLKGLERADSIAWDPHKMMWMPISAGTVLVKDNRHLDAAVQQNAPYLFQPQPGEDRPRDLGQRTLQCSRRADALKVWISLRTYGSEYFGRLQERTVALTRLLHEKLESAADFEPAHEPEANILCFRFLPRVRGDAAALDALQLELRQRYNRSGQGWITSTVLDGKRVLRVTLINPMTEERHLDRLLNGLREVASGL